MTSFENSIVEQVKEIADAQGEGELFTRELKKELQQVQYHHLPVGLDSLPFLELIAEELLNEVYDWNKDPKTFLTQNLNPQFGGSPKTFSELKARAELEYSKDNDVFSVIEFNNFLQSAFRSGLLHKVYEAPKGIESRERVVKYLLNPEAMISCNAMELDQVFNAPENVSLDSFEESLLKSINNHHSILKDDLIEEILGDTDPEKYESLYDELNSKILSLESKALIVSNRDELDGIVLTVTERGNAQLMENSSTNVA